MKRIFLAGTLIGLCISFSADASNLTYQPQNPSFVGSPLNGQYLLQNARAQDDNEAPDDGGFGDPLSQSPADRFKRQLQSQLLGNLATQVSDAIFGTEGGQDPQDEGKFVYDNITVDFRRTSDAVRIDIVDSRTGEVTNIQVPTLDSGSN